MKYLVDANVLSEPTRIGPNRTVVEWLRNNERDITIDPIILGEIRFGINLLPPGKRRGILENWFDKGIARVQCLNWDSVVGLRWAHLLADLRKTGSAMQINDSMIAASALANELIVATRNVKNFEKAGVEVVNPFTSV